MHVTAGFYTRLQSVRHRTHTKCNSCKSGVGKIETSARHEANSKDFERRKCPRRQQLCEVRTVGQSAVVTDRTKHVNFIMIRPKTNHERGTGLCSGPRKGNELVHTHAAFCRRSKNEI